jgi:hypothetical protein
VVVDDVSRLWAPSAPTVTCGPAPGRRPDQVAMHVSIQSGSAIGAGVASALPRPLDLSSLLELRFWARGYAPADGRSSAPFRLELGYRDTGDAAGDEHSWLVPVDQPGHWEEHRIGLGSERRTAVTEVFLRAVTDRPVELTIAPLIAVDEQIPADVAAALADLVAQRAGRPGPLCTTAVAAPAGASTLITTFEPGLRAGNRILVELATGPVPADVAAAAPDENAGQTTLTLRAQTALPAVPTGTPVLVTAPVVWEPAAALSGTPPEPTPDPAILLSQSDIREDLSRVWSLPLRDSFRGRGGVTVCSLRPPPLPVALEYQILVLAGDDGQRNRILAGLLPLLRSTAALPVNGVDLPMASLTPPPRFYRDRAPLAPLEIQVDARVETGPRAEVPWVQVATVDSGQLPPADDTETVVIRS